MSARRYKPMLGEDKFRSMAVYEVQDEKTFRALMKSGHMKALRRDYDRWFGKVSERALRLHAGVAHAVGGAVRRSVPRSPMSDGMRYRTSAWRGIGFLVLIAAGCARPDWIEQTLVTVDVTGAWQGTMSSAGGAGPGTVNAALTLQQGGSKVTGLIVTGYFGLPGSRPIEGTINGDALRFRTQDGRITGELQVSGDEMSGQGTSPGGGNVSFRFRRQP